MTPTSSNEEIQTIRRVEAQRTAAVGAGEIEQLAGLMTDDIVVIHGDGRIVYGKETVVNNFARSLRDSSVQQKVESEETIVAGQWAFDRATVHPTIKPHRDVGAKQLGSRSVTILRKQNDGAWFGQLV